ncbi:uncharacterized protein [Apostichopus japonicus]|uniref:uncharacterized protein n=1 Tax=Stichopus japonicus TaxID=307972 RepID=UPI003AB425C3
MWDMLHISVYNRPSTSGKEKRKVQHKLPVLHKKRKSNKDQPVVSPLESVKKEVNAAFLGVANIDIENLEVGLKLREVNVQFLTKLKEAMLDFTNHSYQPLTVIAKTLENWENFSEATVNGYHYEVIGGIHNLTACKDLREENPDKNVFATRLCVIYSRSLSKDAKLWLANKHNKIGETRHQMSLKEKVKEQRTINLLCNIVSRDDDEEYNLLEEVLQMSEHGQLLGQKVKTGKMFVDAVKPCQLRYLTGLPASSTKTLLKELSNGMMTLGRAIQGGNA